MTEDSMARLRAEFVQAVTDIEVGLILLELSTVAGVYGEFKTWAGRTREFRLIFRDAHIVCVIDGKCIPIVAELEEVIREDEAFAPAFASALNVLTACMLSQRATQKAWLVKAINDMRTTARVTQGVYADATAEPPKALAADAG